MNVEPSSRVEKPSEGGPATGRSLERLVRRARYYWHGMAADSAIRRGDLWSAVEHIEKQLRMPPERFYTCHKHGWDALGKPCPKCVTGDAPTVCEKHGWAAVGKGCPKCASGQ